MKRHTRRPFSETAEVNGFEVRVPGSNDGQAMVIHSAGYEFLLVGFRSSVSFKFPAIQRPTLQNVRVRRVSWSRDHWSADGKSEQGVNQSQQTLGAELDRPRTRLLVRICSSDRGAYDGMDPA
jgi:hypothetical protein